MAELNQPQASKRLKCIQALLGVGAYMTVALPYLRRTHGLDRIPREQHYLFLSNHVSLLDTLLLGALAWRSGRYPILVLGDKTVWRASRFKRFLSRHIGFLLERGRLNPRRIQELQAFGRASRDFDLVVFPEGTRGDGVNVAECQPGIYYIAQEARVPIVPVFIENMQLVSTKKGPFHPFAGLRQVEVHYGEPIDPQTYLPISRPDFTEFVREQISALRPTPQSEHLSPAFHRD